MARGRKGLGVEPLAGSIRIKFTLDGHRTSETVAWEPTPANIRRAKRLAMELRRDMEAGALDQERYRRYFPDSKRLAKPAATDRTLGDWCAKYLSSCGQLSANTLAQFRIQLDFWKKLLGSERAMEDV